MFPKIHVDCLHIFFLPFPAQCLARAIYSKIIHWLNGHEFEQTLGDSEGQSDVLQFIASQRFWCNLMTEQQNNPMMIIQPQAQVDSQDSNSSYLLPFTHGITDFLFFFQEEKDVGFNSVQNFYHPEEESSKLRPRYAE